MRSLFCMPKLSLSRISELAKTPAFFEGMRLSHGGFAAAGRQLKISPKLLSEFANAPPRTYKPSDAKLKAMQKAIAKMSRGNYEVADQYMRIKATKITPNQLAYMKQQTSKSESGRRYFRKAVRDAYAKNFKHIRYGAIDPLTGKTFVTSPAKKKVRRGKSRKGTRRVHRHRR